MVIEQEHLVCWLRACKTLFENHRDHLTELDLAIGDGDHGLNMCRGFNKVDEQLNLLEDCDIGALFKTVGMTLLSSVGGASGPLYGTLFIKAAPCFSGKNSLDLTELYTGLNAGVQGLTSRGKAKPGDKTLCDVWWPVITSLENSCKKQTDISNALKQAFEIAEKAAHSTIEMQAHKGRASYLGERSIGHQDPGATSSMLMIKALYDVTVS